MVYRSHHPWRFSPLLFFTRRQFHAAKPSALFFYDPPMGRNIEGGRDRTRKKWSRLLKESSMGKRQRERERETQLYSRENGRVGRKLGIDRRHLLHSWTTSTPATTTRRRVLTLSIYRIYKTGSPQTVRYSLSRSACPSSILRAFRDIYRFLLILAWLARASIHISAFDQGSILIIFFFIIICFLL